MSLLTLLKCIPTGVEDGQQAVDLFPIKSEATEADSPKFDIVLMVRETIDWRRERRSDKQTRND